jgi:hypothetical protein
MTNRHCTKPTGKVGDARRFYVAASSERQVLLEGWAYTMRANLTGVENGTSPSTIPFWDPALLELNDDSFTRPTSEAARRLCDLGVRWVFVDKTVPHADRLEPYAERRLNTRWSTVYQLVEP